ncbi:ABC transporter ATP-binding protein [Campylobacter sp. VicNov18]|uniref:tungstate ABC transporter ATP-binding protein TupC n=1 Tax=Campylobacter bilis TaxID=2691918 RepID=UPI00130D59AB|nr:tungstate ABC transporter ATP-binding protein TupC [Campylobacter bilis]MPV63914.1 ATP-binding cassette domain-containing protein [Campylobacter hepaticus]MBM0637415.1 ATP-binding cassette domain-containing protein [Campylobacter bilis]MCC8278136.1 ABC transporter ATP-binding protein [Campylobacter bilis]MCC8299640.1 ABC transporter ATP-binding protein [Campylobacter bilis]MCC8301045.1 ABC transporter ATP-binding protein [Campylobacter bilis]
MIEINNLCFKYQNKEILKIKHLELDTSKITILMGANGSGKSTFLRILKFLEGDFSKNISYFGNYKLTNKQKRAIYLLFPEPVLLNRSVRSNFLFTLKTYGIKDNIQNRIKESLACLKLDESILDKSFNELSSGQSQKLAFAMALSTRAKYYLLDEPSAFLDKNTAILFKNAIVKMHERFNTGFLIASHDKHFLDALAQKKLYLHSGEILEFENTNVFDLENKGVKFSNFIDFSQCQKYKAFVQNPPNKIAINPYKIYFFNPNHSLKNNAKFVLYKCYIIALRSRKEDVFVRVDCADKILEFALEKQEFLKSDLRLYKELNLYFYEDAICFLK